MIDIEKNYHVNYMDFETLKSIQKMPENRADGTETEEERLRLSYSRSEVESEKKHLGALLKSIKNEGFDNKAKTFIIGCCEDRPGVYFLMDGQHIRAIAGILIEEGILPSDTQFQYTINYYKTYADMVKALSYLNNGKPMKGEQISRAKTFNNGKCGPGYELYMKMEDKYYGLVRDSLIRICIFGQNNGTTIYSKHITEYHEELIRAYINLIEAAKSVGADAELMGVIEGVQHGMITLRDLYNTFFTEVFKKYGETIPRDVLINKGMSLCAFFNLGLLGRFSNASSGYTFRTIQTMLGYTGNNFKRELNRYIKSGVVRFYGAKDKKNKNLRETSDMIIDCVEKWSKNALK